MSSSPSINIVRTRVAKVFVYCFTLLLAFCIALTIFLSHSLKDGYSLDAWIYLVIIAPTAIMFVWSIVRMWPIVQLDEKGVSRSLLWGLLKKQIPWTEIKEIRTIKSRNKAVWIFFSKSSLQGNFLQQCIRSKHSIGLMLTSDKIVRFVKTNTHLDIVGDKY